MDHNFTLTMPRCSTDVKQRFFNTRCIGVWNRLPGGSLCQLLYQDRLNFRVIPFFNIDIDSLHFRLDSFKFFVVLLEVTMHILSCYFLTFSVMFSQAHWSARPCWPLLTNCICSDNLVKDGGGGCKGKRSRKIGRDQNYTNAG